MNKTQEKIQKHKIAKRVFYVNYSRSRCLLSATVKFSAKRLLLDFTRILLVIWRSNPLPEQNKTRQNKAYSLTAKMCFPKISCESI